MKKSFVKRIQGPVGIALPTGSSRRLQPIPGLDGRTSGIANGVLAQFPVGKILVESVSRISQTVLCCAVQFSAVRLLCGRWVLSVQTSFDSR